MNGSNAQKRCKFFINIDELLFRLVHSRSCGSRSGDPLIYRTDVDSLHRRVHIVSANEARSSHPCESNPEGVRKRETEQIRVLVLKTTSDFIMHCMAVSGV